MLLSIYIKKFARNIKQAISDSDARSMSMTNLSTKTTPSRISCIISIIALTIMQHSVLKRYPMQ